MKIKCTVTINNKECIFYTETIRSMTEEQVDDHVKNELADMLCLEWEEVEDDE